jgi:hypothetical protein
MQVERLAVQAQSQGDGQRVIGGCKVVAQDTIQHGQHGVADVHGIDGAYNSVGALRIDKTRFTPVDLERPFTLERAFDCAVSLEVAEHVSAAHADQFVDSLIKFAPIVVFSAAIPFQGGFQHINEQWPDYWAERFQRRVISRLRHCDDRQRHGCSGQQCEDRIKPGGNRKFWQNHR